MISVYNVKKIGISTREELAAKLNPTVDSLIFLMVSVIIAGKIIKMKMEYVNPILMDIFLMDAKPSKIISAYNVLIDGL